MSKIRVVIVDDHAVVRQGFRATLESASDIEVVGEAGDGREAVRVVKAQQPDVVLLDLQIPGASGPELCWQIGDASENSAILILSAFLNPHLLKSCMMGGARGYLLKDAEDLDMAAQVRAAHAGNTIFDPRVADMAATLLRTDDNHIALSRRELQVLKLMAEACTNSEIAETLFISVNTVKGHVKEVLSKLGARNRVEAVTEGRLRNLV